MLGTWSWLCSDLCSWVTLLLCSFRPASAGARGAGSGDQAARSASAGAAGDDTESDHDEAKAGGAGAGGKPAASDGLAQERPRKRVKTGHDAAASAASSGNAER
jgi:hypothetical protein